MAWEFDYRLRLLAAPELFRDVLQHDSPIHGIAENEFQGFKLDVVTPRGNRRPALPLPSVNLSEANRLHGQPAKERRQPDERDPPAIIRFRLEAGLDRREPFIRKFLEPDIPILPALQTLGFRAEFHQPPLRDREVGRLERAPDLLAVDLDRGLIKSIAVPVEALGDLVKLLRFFRHLIHAKEYRVT